MSSTRSIAFLALASGLASVAKAQSGTGTTTRYWDCCMPSCGWSGKADVSAPVGVCDVNNNLLTVGSGTQNGCDGGDAYMCADQSPWAVSDTLAYGFAATHIAGESESDWCCSCYELTFTSTSLATSGKKMIVQATNTGGDLNSNQFDLAIPGGGVGIFNGCTNEWGAPSSGWGAQYGGISSNTCSTFPTALQPGCNFRFGWFEGADNPAVSFQKVTCPAALTAKTGCVRAGETPTGPSSVGSEAATSAASSAASSSASSPAAYSSAASAASASSVAASSAASSSAAYSSAAVPVSSSEAAPAFTMSTFASSAVATSQPGAYSSISSTSADAVSSSASLAASPPSPSAAAAASTAASTDAQCDVHYEYVYDL